MPKYDICDSIYDLVLLLDYQLVEGLVVPIEVLILLVSDYVYMDYWMDLYGSNGLDGYVAV